MAARLPPDRFRADKRFAQSKSLSTPRGGPIVVPGLNNRKNVIGVPKVPAAAVPPEPHGVSDSENVDEHDVYIIAPGGDLVLSFSNEEHPDSAPFRFRVSSKALRLTSAYFEAMLHPAHFAEGQTLASAQSVGVTESAEPTPSDLLPTIHIEDVGHISSVNSVKRLLIDVLSILHDVRLRRRVKHVSNLSNMVTVADRFAALPKVKKYLTESVCLNFVLGSTLSPSSLTSLNENQLRQLCYVGIQLSDSSVLQPAGRMLLRKAAFRDAHTADQPLWWDLPGGWEAEFAFRRDCILETIQSVQTYFLNQYLSNKRQCRNGDYSCDSFQLGQMVKFFTRINTLDLVLGGTLVDGSNNSESDRLPRDGDLQDIVDQLKGCQEYQIDSFHQHCGLRVRLLPAIKILEEGLQQLDFCLTCWNDRRDEYSWVKRKRPLHWSVVGIHRDSTGSNNGGEMCAPRHRNTTRNMFMAVDRTWENKAS